MTALMLFLLTACGGDAERSAFEDLRASMAGDNSPLPRLSVAGLPSKVLMMLAPPGAAMR